MASSRISTRRWRSSPLSLATWSRMRFRLTFCCMSLVLPPKIRLGVELEVGLRDLIVRDAVQDAGPVLAARRAGRGADDGTVGLHVNPLPGVAVEVDGLPQRTIEAGRAD